MSHGEVANANRPTEISKKELVIEKNSETETKMSYSKFSNN